jgi:hypothetical protein
MLKGEKRALLVVEMWEDGIPYSTLRDLASIS